MLLTIDGQCVRHDGLIEGNLMAFQSGICHITAPNNGKKQSTCSRNYAKHCTESHPLILQLITTS